MSNRERTPSATTTSDLAFQDWLNRLAAQAQTTPQSRTVRRGDVWQLGSHRLMCGDSTRQADVKRLMDGQQANMLFTSPPYLDQRTYLDEKRLRPHSSKQKNDNPVYYDAPTNFNALMRGVVDCLPTTDDAQLLFNFGQKITNGCVVDYFDDWKQYMKSSGFKHRDTYIWDKGVAKPFVIWRLMRQHEEIFHFSKKTRIPNKTVEKKPESINYSRKYYVNRQQDGSMWRQKNKTATNTLQTHRQDSSVLTVSPQAGEDRARRNVHPAVFPLELVRRIVPIWTMPGELVYEPFAGSGTTLLGCEEIGRRCFGMEILPNYCGHILDQWEQMTGKRAIKAV